MIQGHGGIRFRQVISVILIELGGLVRDHARCPALVAVLQPEQIRGNGATLELLVDIRVGEAKRF